MFPILVSIHIYIYIHFLKAVGFLGHTKSEPLNPKPERQVGVVPPKTQWPTGLLRYLLTELAFGFRAPGLGN